MSAVRILSLLSACGSMLVTSAIAFEDVISGLPAGAPTVSIPVLDVTGPYKGQRICYVCEFQDFPNVLAFFRGTDDETAELIVALNDLYVRNKDRDFKAVAMVAAGPDASAWLEELSVSASLEIPLTVFRKGPADLAGRLYELNPEVGNTFLVTLDRFVVANVAGIEPAEFGRVVDATERMLASLDVEAVSAEQVQALIRENEGSVVVVNFWATWCPPCLKEFPDLIDVYEQNRSRGMTVIAVSMNAADETQDIEEFLQRFAPPFPVYRAASVDDEFFQGIVQPWFGELPITLVFDTAGELRHYHRKAITRDELSAEIDARLASP